MLDIGTDKSHFSGATSLDLDKSALGQYGAKRITGTTAVTPDPGFVFVAIQAEAETVIATTTGNITGFDGSTLGVEAMRVGRFSSITLTSGTVIAYQGV